MHANTRSLLDRVARVRRCGAGGFGQEISALLSAITEATVEAIGIAQAFDAAEEAEQDGAVLQSLYQYQQKFGAIERELRKLREQLQNVRAIQREISELDTRVGATLRERP